MLTLTMMNDNDVASKLKATIRILFVFDRIILLIICIRQNSHDPLFRTALTNTHEYHTKHTEDIVLSGSRKLILVMSKGSENWHFSFVVAPAGKSWDALVVLGSHYL